MSFIIYMNPELVQERISFGRNGEYDFSEFIDAKKLGEISAVHFTIIKNNVSDPLCPVFLEVSSHHN